MIPKKPNILIKEVSEDLELSEDLVDKFISFYYKDIRKQLSELNHIRINLDGLGQMVIKPKTISKLIDKCNNKINKANTYEFSGYFNKKKLESRLESLYIIEKKIEDFKTIKSEFKKNIKDEFKKNLE